MRSKKPDKQFTGYLIDLEDRDALAASADWDWSKACALGDAEIPKSIDPLLWHRFENQGNMSSCVGHGGSSTAEACYYFATDGQVVQFSRMYVYLMAQRQHNMRGDSGAVISGAVKSMMTDGVSLEEFFPYPKKYTTVIPEAAHESAKNFKIAKQHGIKSYDDAFKHLALRIGGIIYGIRWLESFSNPENNRTIEEFSGRTQGGHCIALLGYSERKDSKGRNYLRLVNSHARYGDRGVVDLSPSAFEATLRDEFTSCYGLSDMDNVRPRSPALSEGIYG